MGVASQAAQAGASVASPGENATAASQASSRTCRLTRAAAGSRHRLKSPSAVMCNLPGVGSL